MPENPIGMNVLDRALERLDEIYSNPNNRIVVAFSGGKDSTVVLNLAIEAARKHNRLPVEASFFDEEISFPGTTEYVERVHANPDVKLRWFSARCPQINIFDRQNPYWWTFDNRLNPSDWVRQPPPYIEWMEDNELKGAITPRRFPLEPGQTLIAVLGIRAAESRWRRMSIFSSKGFLSQVNKFGHRTARPIFDWQDGDVWKYIWDRKVDYNSAYKTFHRLGVSRYRLRIGPPTMTRSAIGNLQKAAKAWPRWFDRVSQRLPGVRTAGMFGKRSCSPKRHLGESWEDCYQRTCIDNAPDWIAERAIQFRDQQLRTHARHSRDPMPEVAECGGCTKKGCWRKMTNAMFMGDPYALATGLAEVPPEKFREGAGSWWKSDKDRKKEEEVKKSRENG